MGTQLADLISLDDVEKRALDILPKAVRGYYESGADDEQTLRNNREAFANFWIRPFALRDVSRVDTSVRIVLRSPANPNTRPFSRTFNYPIGIAPTAFQRMAHDEGEIATVKVAAETGTPMICSTLSTVQLEQMAKEAPAEGCTLWFQLYIYKDRALTEKIVRRAERAGFSALVLTVDAPLFGRRRADERNAFQLPSHLRIANFVSSDEHSTTFEGDVGSSGLSRYVISLFDASLNWEHLRWLIQFTELPVLVKGIVRADDALRALEAGVAGIVVSNHGGRQLDHCVPTIEALPEVISAIDGRIPVFVDGGFRCGTDVFKALAMGADLVFIGRPIVYGLAIGGKDGVRHVLGLIRTELDYAMKLSGCPTIAHIRSAEELVVRRHHFTSKL